MTINYLVNIFKNNIANEIMVWKSQAYIYGKLLELIDLWDKELINNNIQPGDVVALLGDFSPNAIALLLSLIKKNCIVAPITTKNKVKQEEYLKIAQVKHLIEIDLKDAVQFANLSSISDNKLLKNVREQNHPGLIIFSSGSTGQSKAVVHDLYLLLEKFKTPKRCARVIAFLLFDHIGGLNTLFYTLFNAGCLVIAEDRSPQSICESIEKFKVDALTTSPTFLNLLILSGIYEKYDLSSLRVINYSSEIMPENTLNKLSQLFPNVRLSQAYGLSELGVLPVRSKSSNSLLIKIDNANHQVRVVNGLLEIKSNSSMLGYLNAPQPFTNDGWFITGDAVEQDGEYLRILGRISQLINVGGEKVYPAEIENVLEQISGVEEASVYSEHNAITGQMVVAKIKLTTAESLAQFRLRLYEFCRSRLPKYKIPQKITLTHSSLINERFKKIRSV